MEPDEVSMGTVFDRIRKVKSKVVGEKKIELMATAYERASRIEIQSGQIPQWGISDMLFTDIKALEKSDEMIDEILEKLEGGIE